MRALLRDVVPADGELAAGTLVPGLVGRAPLVPSATGGLLRLQRCAGNRAVARLLQRSGRGAEDAGRALAEAVKAEVDRAGGLNVVVYLRSRRPPGTKKYNNDQEFKRQADQYADDHGSFGVAGGRLRRGEAMRIDEELSVLLGRVTREASALLAEHPDLYPEGMAPPQVKVQTLSVFTHGGKRKVQSGATGTGWVGAEQFARGLAPLLTATPTVNLFACSVAGQVPEGRRNVATGIQEQLAASLEEIYGISFVEVWGHSTAAHTTFNPQLAGVGPFGASDLRVDFGARLADVVIAELELAGATFDAEQRQAVEQAAAELIVDADEPRSRFLFAPGAREGDVSPPGRNRSVFTGFLNPMNVYFREIPLLGLERVWADLTSEVAPTSYTDTGVSEEASARMVEGVTFFRDRFADMLDQLRGEAMAVGSWPLAGPQPETQEGPLHEPNPPGR